MRDDEEVLETDTGHGCTAMCFFPSSNLITSKDQVTEACYPLEEKHIHYTSVSALKAPGGQLALETGLALTFPTTRPKL